MLTHLHGMKIIQDANLTQPGPPTPVRRSWHERLFTRPWKPWQKTKMITPQIPYQGFYQLGGNTILIHPAMLRVLQETLNEAP